MLGRLGEVTRRVILRRKLVLETSKCAEEEMFRHVYLPPLENVSK
jgi:hypothetical protein